MDWACWRLEARRECSITGLPYDKGTVNTWVRTSVYAFECFKDAPLILFHAENILLRNVRAQSSPKRRCLETSLAVLAGLLPPTNTSTWSKTSQLAQLWTPIAVETVEPARAWLLNPDTECKAASAIKDALPTADAEMKKFLEENKDFVEKVSAKTGNTFPSWVQVGWIYDALFTEKAFFGSQFQLPDWLAQIGPDTLSRLKQFNDYQFTIFTKWPKYTKLRAGLLLQQTIDNMMAVANQKEQVSALNRKLFLYGTHDTMCSPISLALGYTTGLLECSWKPILN